MTPRRTPRARHILLAVVLAVLLAVSALYTWQVAAAWGARGADAQPRWFGAGLVGQVPAGYTQTIDLRGTGVAAAAGGALSVDSTGARGVLQVWDLPELPDGKTYQLWCVDAAGGVSSPALFNPSADDGGLVTITVGTDRMIYDYTRFFITVEPDGGSTVPAGPVVMRGP